MPIGSHIILRLTIGVAIGINIRLAFGLVLGTFQETLGVDDAIVSHAQTRLSRAQGCPWQSVLAREHLQACQLLFRSAHQCIPAAPQNALAMSAMANPVQLCADMASSLGPRAPPPERLVLSLQRSHIIWQLVPEH